MKKLLTPILAALSIFCSHAQAGEFEGHGVSFTHSDDLKTTVTGDAVKTIVAKDNKGIQFLIQDYKALITPEKLNGMMVKSLLEKFAGKSKVLPNKTVVRSLLGKKREGKCLIIIEQDLPIECIVFTFKEGDNTYCVMTQQPLKDTPAAEDYFAQIQASLKLTE